MSSRFGKRYFPVSAPALLALMLTLSISVGCATVALSGDSVAAKITSPDPTVKLTSTLVEFKWDAGTNVKQYWLYIGKAKGEKDIYSEDQKDNLSALVSGLPSDGSKIFVRLWSHIDKDWDYNDYTYTACTGCDSGNALGQITSPLPGSKLTETSVTFKWSAGKSASQYWLAVGKSPGGHQYYNGDHGTKLEATVGKLPNDGSTIYVRLWSKVGDKWLYNDYTYKTCSGCAVDGIPAEIIKPTPGSTLESSVVTFEWSAGKDVTRYQLYVGTKEGAKDIYGKIEGEKHSAMVTGIPNDGSTIYVRLWSMISNNWLYKDYTYKSCKGCVDPAEMISPDPGEMLPGPRVTFTWDAGSGMARYRLSAGKKPGGTDYYDEETPTLHKTVTDLPTDGSVIYVRLSSLPRTIAPSLVADPVAENVADWKSVDYIYIAYLGSADIAELTSPEPGSILPGAKATFAWDKGREVDQYWLFIGKTLGGQEYYNGANEIGNKQSWDVVNLPTDGSPVFVRLWSRIDDTWRFHDYVFLAASK